VEQTVTVNTAAAGGNVALLTGESQVFNKNRRAQ
jgi:hypothetical protein